MLLTQLCGPKGEHPRLGGEGGAGGGGSRKNRRKFNRQQGMLQRVLGIILSITRRACRRPVSHQRQPARALHAHCTLLLDYVPPEEPPSTPLGNALRIR